MPDSCDVLSRCSVTAVTSMHNWMAVLPASLATKPRTWHAGHKHCADDWLTDAKKSCQQTSAETERAGRAWLFPSWPPLLAPFQFLKMTAGVSPSLRLKKKKTTAGVSPSLRQLPAIRPPFTGIAEDALTTAFSPTRNTPEFRASAKPRAYKKSSGNVRVARPIETKGTRPTLSSQANAGQLSPESDSTKDASRKAHASRPATSRPRTYDRELQHRTAQKRRLPTPTPWKILQAHNEAADRAQTLDHGLRHPLRHDHRRAHEPRQFHNEDLHKLQTHSPERTAQQGSAPRLLNLRTDKQDNDREFRHRKPAPKPTKAPVNGPPSTSGERCRAYTQATKL